MAGETKVQFHNDQTHLLVVHESQIAMYDSKLECLRSVSSYPYKLQLNCGTFPILFFLDDNKSSEHLKFLYNGNCLYPFICCNNDKLLLCGISADLLMLRVSELSVFSFPFWVFNYKECK